jgi:hypothetical protein
MKRLIKAIPLVGPIAVKINRLINQLNHEFPGSKNYWEKRYQDGGNSGAGSYNKLAEYKADVLNDFVQNNHIENIIEYGCGDGNQLQLAKYPSYVGFDVSQNAIDRCNHLFVEDRTKKFKLLDEYKGEVAQLTMSLDVIYHLIEDQVYFSYMKRLFESSSRFVAIYSSNSDGQQYKQSPHVKHRKFTDWVEKNQPNWQLLHYIPNKYPYIEDNYDNGSFSDFYIWKIRE